MTWRRITLLGLKVVALLWLFDRGVAGPFFRIFTAPSSGPPELPLLRDHSAGENVRLLMDLVAANRSPSLRIAYIGDSTMETMGIDQKELPYIATANLRTHRPDLEITPIHAGLIGLYGSDAALMLSKLLDERVDYVVYGIVPRALPTSVAEHLRNALRRQMWVSDLVRFAERGELPWLVENFSAEEIAGRNGVDFIELTDVLLAEDFRKSMYDPDGRDPIHPSESGRAKLGRRIARALSRMIPKEGQPVTKSAEASGGAAAAPGI